MLKSLKNNCNLGLVVVLAVTVFVMSACSSPESYTVKGVIVHKQSPQVIIIEHEKIPGFMEAMTMPFELEQVGMAKDFFASETQTFRGSLGAGVSVARFDPGPLRRDEGTSGRPRFHEGPRSDKDLNLHLSFRYTRKLFRGAYIEEILVLRPSLTDIGHGRAEFESSVYVPLSPKLKLRIDVLVDYEDRLHFNGLDDWRTSVGAGIRFDF